VTLEERAEFVRLYTLAFAYPRPVDHRGLVDGLLEAWYVERGPAGVPCELALFAAESHAD
jgi:hypothetical protein